MREAIEDKAGQRSVRCPLKLGSASFADLAVYVARTVQDQLAADRPSGAHLRRRRLRCVPSRSRSLGLFWRLTRDATPPQTCSTTATPCSSANASSSSRPCTSSSGSAPTSSCASTRLPQCSRRPNGTRACGTASGSTRSSRMRRGRSTRRSSTSTRSTTSRSWSLSPLFSTWVRALMTECIAATRNRIRASTPTMSMRSPSKEVRFRGHLDWQTRMLMVMIATGQFLPTRRTDGVSTSELLQRIVEGYRCALAQISALLVGILICAARQGGRMGQEARKAGRAGTVLESGHLRKRFLEEPPRRRPRRSARGRHPSAHARRRFARRSWKSEGRLGHAIGSEPGRRDGRRDGLSDAVSVDLVEDCWAIVPRLASLPEKHSKEIQRRRPRDRPSTQAGKRRADPHPLLPLRDGLTEPSTQHFGRSAAPDQRGACCGCVVLNRPGDETNPGSGPAGRWSGGGRRKTPTPGMFTCFLALVLPSVCEALGLRSSLVLPSNCPQSSTSVPSSSPPPICVPFTSRPSTHPGSPFTGLLQHLDFNSLSLDAASSTDRSSDFTNFFTMAGIRRRKAQPEARAPAVAPFGGEPEAPILVSSTSQTTNESVAERVAVRGWRKTLVGRRQTLL